MSYLISKSNGRLPYDHTMHEETEVMMTVCKSVESAGFQKPN